MASSLNTKCKDWIGHVDSEHGIAPLKYGTQWAHIIAYIDTYGPVPEGKQVNHRCGRGICVEPTHLYAGTQSQNMQDCASHGTHNSVKLTEDEVREIREYASNGTSQKELALMYDVNKSTISYIVNRKKWKHVA